MIKPEHLKKGDKVALVSLSWGGIGNPEYIHKYDIAKKRLLDEFGIELVPMPHALLGEKYVAEHPEDRASDLMEAFKDPTIKGIFCAIGGDDTIRTLPYIDFDVIKNNPKIFMGYSDSTINHFMMHKAGLVSYYGPTVMCEIAEYVKMFDYTKEAMENILFKDSKDLEIKSSPEWSDHFVAWDIKNINVSKKMIKEEHGYEIIQGKGVVSGPVLGGCIDVFYMAYDTSIWPTDWENKILLLETSEVQMKPEELKDMLIQVGEKEVFDKVLGIIVGKPYQGVYYDEYKSVIKDVLKMFNKEDLPVLYNVNIGHAFPNGIIPLGTLMEVDYDNKKIKLLESATK